MSASDLHYVQRAALSEMHEAFTKGADGIVITAAIGMGKTTLANAFVQNASDLFPGGVEVWNAELRSSAAGLRIPPHPMKRVPRTLVIVEDADYLSREALSQLYSALEERPRHFPIILSRHPIYVPLDFRIIRLDGFSQIEFMEFLKRATHEAGRAIDPDTALQFFNRTAGNPLLASMAAQALANKSARSLKEFLSYLRDFETLGLVDPTGQPLSTRAEHKLVASVTTTNDEIIRRLKNDPELARTISPRKFEELVAELLHDMGFEVTLTPPSRDGGFDIRAARKDGLGSFLYLVECKRFLPAHKVGINVIRSLYGVVQQQNANAGAVVTTSLFSSDAKEFRQTIEHKMHLHDYITLQKWVSDFPLKKR